MHYPIKAERMITMTASTATVEMKKKFVLERLLAAGVTRSQMGEDIRNLDYEELKYELVLHEFRVVDTECGENAWF